MTYVFRAGQIRRLKEGVNESGYFAKHPDAYKVSKPPSESTLERWNAEGYCKALDGCKVEPDGDCPHGKPSWLKAMNFI